MSMDNDSGNNDPAQLLMGLMKAGQEAWLQAARASAATPPPAQNPLGDLAAMSAQFIELQQSYLNQVNSAWLNLLGMPSAPPAADKRFGGDSWKSDPRFEALTRSYLAYSTYLKGMVESAPVDEKAKAQLRFSVRQFTDAMSPANFIATNPEALQLAQETGGKSLAEGMSLFFHDLALGRISMTDEQAFEVGRNVAVSPGAVVFENEVMQLIQYSPRSDQVYERPLLMVPPCINKFYILDLQPANSLVRYAVEQGHTVFMVSWRNVDAQSGHLTWDDYVERGVLQALQTTLAISGADRANTLGFCVGGTLLASALAVAAARGLKPAASATLLTTMLDFADTGEIGNLISEASVAQREAAIGGGGILSGKELNLVFSSLRANDLIWQYVVNSYLKGQKPPAFDLLYWNSDGTNLPGPMFCWYVRQTYLENRLREPRGTTQCGVPVDLSAVDIPAYLYASREDHIVPWQSAYASRAVLGGETTYVLGASGHIAGVINPPEKRKRNYWVEGAPAPNAEDWVQNARSEPGSWWPHWSDWISRFGGSKVPARELLGNAAHKPTEAAPGRYVKERLA